MSLIRADARFVVGHKQFYCLIKFINKLSYNGIMLVVTRFERKSEFMCVRVCVFERLKG